LFVRKPAVPASLALAGICILLHNPADLFSAGLQLSFVAVLGIWTFTLPLERAIFGQPDELDRLAPSEGRGFLYYVGGLRIKSLACASLAAWLANAPLAAQHFNVFTPVAPLATFALLPLLPPLIVAGLAGALLGPISAVAAKPLLAVAGGCAWALEWACRTVAPLSGAHFYLPPPGWPILLLCYAVFAAIAYRAELRLTRACIAGLMFIPALAYLGFVWRQPPPRHTQVAAISVGRGNCILTRFPDGRSVLFDAGSAGRADEIAERVIVPALWSLGVRRLDLLFLSHGDSDHYNGAEELARRMRVGRVAVTDYFDGQSGPASFRKPGPAALLQRLTAMGIPLTRFGAEDRVLGFSGAEVEALWPPRLVPPVKWTDNELCAVVRVRSPEGQRILLTGDFGQGGTGPLLRRHPDLRADVLQVPHHGRADPSAPEFADAVRPAVAIIPGGHHAWAADYYAAASKRLLATDDCGMVTVELDGGPPRIETFRKNGN
jgi:competence protein ComEC